MVTKDNITGNRLVIERSMKDAFMISKRCMVTKYQTTLNLRDENEREEEGKVDISLGLPKTYSLLYRSSFLEKFTKSPGVDGVTMYLLCTFQPLHSLHVSMAELVSR